MLAALPLDFRTVAVHIGSEIERRLEDSGIPVTTFAKKVGRSPQNLYKVFKRPSCDTMLLRKCSEVLHFDFFRLYSHDLSIGSSMSMAAEPAAVYQRKAPETVEITIKRTGDNGDELIDRIVKAVEQQGPGPERDKVHPVSRSRATRKPRRSR